MYPPGLGHAEAIEYRMNRYGSVSGPHTLQNQLIPLVYRQEGTAIWRPTLDRKRIPVVRPTDSKYIDYARRSERLGNKMGRFFLAIS